MAARESQGLQIALIIFVILAIAMSVTTYLAFTNFKETEKKLADAQKQASDATSKEQAAKADTADLIAIIGNGSDAKSIKEGLLADFNNGKYSAFGLGPSTPDDQKTLTRVVNGMNSTVTKTYTDAETFNAKAKGLEKQLATEAANNATKLKAAEAARDQAMADLERERAAYKKAVDDLTKEKDTLVQDKGAKDKRLEEQKAGYERQITELNNQLKMANADVAKIKKELEKYFHLDPSASGGQITWVNQRDNMAYINLGWDDGLHRRITFSVFPAGTSDVAKAASKGKIEVVNVTGPHEAEAKIIENPVNNPLLPRDMIHTQGWHPGQHEHFGIAGFIDIDGRGIDETSKLVDLITANGGVVDARLVETKSGEGKVGLKVEGSMSVNTRYLIKGDFSADTPAKTDRATASGALIDQAKNFNVETVGLQKFLAMMGYTPKSSAPGGGTVGGAAANGADDNGGFRPRKPPARGKDDSAF
jgi:phage shock protein A